MVIANFTVKTENPSPLAESTSYFYENINEKKVKPDEWRQAVETLLPRLLGHANAKPHQSKTLMLTHESSYNSYVKTYMDTIGDFGRWIATIGNYLQWRKPSRKRMLTAVPLSEDHMKNFFTLLGC